MTYIACTVTTDLNYDQRMQRICRAMVNSGFEVSLTGCKRAFSKPIAERDYQQRRLSCLTKNGFLHYAEYNFRLFFHLIRLNPNVIYSVDLDTLSACGLYSVLFRKRLIFDSHEFFTELPELSGKPIKKLIWGFIGNLFIKRCDLRITVGEELSKLLAKKYNSHFEVIRNVPDIPQLDEAANIQTGQPKIILYQGALNTGRGLEALIDAMESIPEEIECWIAGEGDLSGALRDRAKASPAAGRVKFLGYLMPDELNNITKQAWLGYNLLENKGLNYYYSLANKFFDYSHSGVPSLNPAFPEYKNHLSVFKTGILLSDLKPLTIAKAVIDINDTPEMYEEMLLECKIASKKWNWNLEQKKLKNLLSRFK